MKEMIQKHVSYFCTWDVQAQRIEKENAERAEKTKASGEIKFAGDQGLTARDAMNEENVFGENGWIHYFPEIRANLYFVIDDGWDVDYHLDMVEKDFPKFGSHVLNEKRFPSFKGTPEEKLKQFVELVKAAGWKGLGIWLPTQALGDDWRKSVKETETYWRAMLERSKYAGVSYWKVDWGFCAHSPEDRKAITDLAREVYPELVVEHGIAMTPINEYLCDDGRFVNDEAYEGAKAFASFSEVLRTYDVTQLERATTMDRVCCLLPESNALLNCESLCFMAAGLGFSLGIMGAPETRNGQEAIAAIRWHEIAPAFVGGETHMSDLILKDYFDFEEGTTWASFLFGRRIFQSAPAILSRNTGLPVVRCNDDQPFVVASSNPSGAYSVAELGRFLEEEKSPLADVQCFPEGSPENIGVFGAFSSISFLLTSIPCSVKVRNLFTDEIVDVTKELKLGKTLTIPGKLLKQFSQAEGKSAVHLMLSY